MADANFPTGRSGLIAVDKIGNQVLFLDAETLETTLTLDAFAPRVHELAISPDHRTAIVPIYGDGIHGKNPHPGHLIALFDLEKRRHKGDWSTYPYRAPHGLRWGPKGELYCVCENSGVVLEMDPADGDILDVIEVGSDKAHRIEVTPDGGKLYTENEEDTFASVVDLRSRKFIKKIPAPNGLAGIGMSPDGRTVVLVDAKNGSNLGNIYGASASSTLTIAASQTIHFTGSGTFGNSTVVNQHAMYLQDSSTAFVTFNLAGMPTGSYIVHTIQLCIL